jgi:photosystem II stability/assembly factor-like uncharacterized protein
VITQLKSFADIDMVTIDAGYAITKGFHVLKTLDGGSSWTDILTLKNQFDYFYYPAIFAVGSQTIYVASYTANNGIVFEKSNDAGKDWSKSEIKIQKDSSGNSVYGGTLVLSFINKSEGFLLISTMPACSLMLKALYRTTDGGNSWIFVGESDSKLNGGGMMKIEGYTTGMAFSNINTGYITCENRSNIKISVYRTTDSGKNWGVF